MWQNTKSAVLIAAQICCSHPSETDWLTQLIRRICKIGSDERTNIVCATTTCRARLLNNRKNCCCCGRATIRTFSGNRKKNNKTKILLVGRPQGRHWTFFFLLLIFKQSFNQSQVISGSGCASVALPQSPHAPLHSVAVVTVASAAAASVYHHLALSHSARAQHPLLGFVMAQPPPPLVAHTATFVPMPPCGGGPGWMPVEFGCCCCSSRLGHSNAIFVRHQPIRTDGSARNCMRHGNRDCTKQWEKWFSKMLKCYFFIFYGNFQFN